MSGIYVRLFVKEFFGEAMQYYKWVVVHKRWDRISKAVYSGLQEAGHPINVINGMGANESRSQLISAQKIVNNSFPYNQNFKDQIVELLELIDEYPNGIWWVEGLEELNMEPCRPFLKILDWPAAVLKAAHLILEGSRVPEDIKKIFNIQNDDDVVISLANHSAYHGYSINFYEDRNVKTYPIVINEIAGNIVIYRDCFEDYD